MYCCPHIGERIFFQKEIGEDWPKLSHIQHIFMWGFGELQINKIISGLKS